VLQPAQLCIPCEHEQIFLLSQHFIAFLLDASEQASDPIGMLMKGISVFIIPAAVPKLFDVEHKSNTKSDLFSCIFQCTK